MLAPCCTWLLLKSLWGQKREQNVGTGCLYLPHREGLALPCLSSQFPHLTRDGRKAGPQLWRLIFWEHRMRMRILAREHASQTPRRTERGISQCPFCHGWKPQVCGPITALQNEMCDMSKFLMLSTAALSPPLPEVTHFPLKEVALSWEDGD